MTKETQHTDLINETKEAVDAIKKEEAITTEYINITPRWEAILPPMLAVLENKKATSESKEMIKSDIMRLGIAIDKLNANGKVTTQ